MDKHYAQQIPQQPHTRCSDKNLKDLVWHPRFSWFTIYKWSKHFSEIAVFEMEITVFILNSTFTQVCKVLFSFLK